ncbi:MAG: nucleotidyltransferase family protein [Candidatus Binatia bacterium]|nr:nucleotidyltransferase family protein [Candidatus Binatia bacterium]
MVATPNPVTAVILAAGRGQRMGDLTRHRPKPLLHVRGKPILEHILLGLRSAGVERVLVVVGYLGEQIVTALGDGRRLSLKIEYAWQPEARGTADALLVVRASINAPFFLSWGDVLVSQDSYRELASAFAAQPAAAWMAVNEVEDPCQGAAVYLDADRRVQRIVEKPARGTSTTRWNNAGVGIYSPDIFTYAQMAPVSPRGERELPQAVDLMIQDGHPVYALPVLGFWSDVGTPEALAFADEHYPA